MSRPPKGKNLPFLGNVLPKHPDDYRLVIAQALRRDLGDARGAIKTVMRWTGAGERTVKTWFSGGYGPQGKHLIDLMRHSDEVAETVLLLTGRHELAGRVKARTTSELSGGSVDLLERVEKWNQAAQIRAFAKAAERYRAATLDPQVRETLLHLAAEGRAVADHLDPLRNVQ